jgi:hypothetical protein
VTQPIRGGAVDPETRAVFSLRSRLGGSATRQCTATLVAPNLLLTARHCLVSTLEGPGCGEPFPPLVAPSAVDLTYATRLDSEEAAEIPVVQAVEFSAPADATPCGADLSLIRIAENFTALDPIPPRLDRSVLAGEVFAAVGYGVTGEFSGGEGTRRRIDGLEVICAGTACGEPLTRREFRGDSGPCLGDSGGPSVREGAQGPELLGVLSRGTDDCAFPIYVAVVPFADFLRAEGQRAAALGGYAPLPWMELPPDPDPGAGGAGGGGGGAPAPAPEPERPEPGQGDASGCHLGGGRPGGVGRTAAVWWLALTALAAVGRRKRAAVRSMRDLDVLR